MKINIRIVVISLLSICACVNLAFAGDSPTISAAAPARTLVVSCNSEDDGVLTGRLLENHPGSLYFDGAIGTMGANRMLRIHAYAQVGSYANGEFRGYVQLCAFNNDYHVPVTCSGSSDVSIRPESFTMITLFTLGQMDPEGVQCHIEIR